MNLQHNVSARWLSVLLFVFIASVMVLFRAMVYRPVTEVCVAPEMFALPEPAVTWKPTEYEWQEPTVTREPTEQEPTWGYEWDARMMMLEFVSRSLLSPRTALYAHYDDWDVRESNGSWTGRAWVECQNPYGVWIRSRFTITVKRVAGTKDTWITTYINFY